VVRLSLVWVPARRRRPQRAGAMTKSIDEMDLEELRAALRWELDEKERILDRLTAYRRNTVKQADEITKAVNNIWRAS
jgi:hypothetical protein